MAVPVKLHFDAAIPVGPDAFPFRPDNFRRLRAIGSRPVGYLRRAIDYRRGDHSKMDLVRDIAIAAAGVAVLFKQVICGGRQIFAIIAKEWRIS